MTIPEIILFGGTFDPPHQGHRDCLSQCQKQFPCAMIIIIPAYSPPGVSVNKVPIASFRQRVQMVQEAFCDDLQSPQIAISTLEKKLPKPNYSIATVKEFVRSYPGKNIALLMGLDQYADFDRWHQVKEMLSLLSSIIVVKRKSDSMSTMKAMTEKVAKNLNRSGYWNEESKLFQFAEENCGVYTIDKEICDAQSRIIRQNIEQNNELPHNWLPPAVRKVINEENLYRKKRN